MTSQKVVFLVFLSTNFDYLQAVRKFDVNGVETIMAMKGENITVQCKSDMPMSYCGFIHPSGTRYSFSGTSLDDGKCSKKIQVSENDSGIWNCHIGGKDSIGIEIMQYISLRVVEQLGAIQKNITTVHGKKVTLTCITTKGMLPLRYCRFEPPNQKTFSINSNVIANNSILGRYYFPSNMSLDRGDCAVTIRKVKYEDVGTWTCGAGFEDGNEHVDTIFVEVEGLYSLSRASVTGITLGSIVATAIFGVLGFMVWKKMKLSELERAEGGEIQMEEAGHASPSVEAVQE